MYSAAPQIHVRASDPRGAMTYPETVGNVVVDELPMDRISPERRSWNMSRIRGRDTGPERIVRSMLHRLGLRFSLRCEGLPGKPDIVLPARRTVVFVHGCFWHQHGNCQFAVMPKTRPEFWAKKLGRNVERDHENVRALRSLGWAVLTVWECELVDPAGLRRRLIRRFGITEGSGVPA